VSRGGTRAVWTQRDVDSSYSTSALDFSKTRPHVVSSLPRHILPQAQTFLCETTYLTLPAHGRSLWHLKITHQMNRYLNSPRAQKKGIPKRANCVSRAHLPLRARGSCPVAEKVGPLRRSSCSLESRFSPHRTDTGEIGLLPRKHSPRRQAKPHVLL